MPVEMRDQQRALKAYELVASVTQDRVEYKAVVNNLGANIIRMGLSAALADLQRRGERGGNRLLDHLGQAPTRLLPSPGLDHSSLPHHVRGLPVDDYMVLTRELLQFSTWLKRAVQAGETA